MAQRLTTWGAPAGTAGASYRRILTYLNKPANAYYLDEASFPGLGPYLPCYAIVHLTMAGPDGNGVGLFITPTNDFAGGFNLAIRSAPPSPMQFGMYLYLDTAHTIYVAADLPFDARIFIQ